MTMTFDATTSPAVTQLKPKLRGWLHAATSPAVLIASLVLMVIAPTPLARLGLAIYLIAGVVMFTNSAVYHIWAWQPAMKQLFRRLDHSFIFVFIAGSYTPLCLSLLSGWDRIVLLSLVWSCATLGLLFRVLWLSAPRILYTALYIVMGWAAVGWMLPLWKTGGAGVVVPLIIGGLIYTAGAVFYALKRPNPFPAWFGFHEVFHLCTVLAAASHFVAISFAVLSTAQ